MRSHSQSKARRQREQIDSKFPKLHDEAILLVLTPFVPFSFPPFRL